MMNRWPFNRSAPKARSLATRGHALAFVLPVIMALGLVSASLVSWLHTEIDINDRHILRQQALIAAESALEYGAAQLAARFDGPRGVASNELLMGNDPLSLPDSATVHFAGSRVVAGDLRVQGGLIPAGEWRYIEAGPGNVTDPLRGRTAFVRDVAIYAKGVAASPVGQVRDPVEAYATEILHVRDSPLFSHAIFYNSDLEINPGHDLDVRGPVHANGNVYIGAKPGATLTLHNGITTAGSIFHGHLREISNHLGGDVYPGGVGEAMKMEYENGKYLDSTHDNWSELSLQRWDGLVLDGQTGVKPSNPAAIGDFQPDDFTTGTDETQNSAYAIIEPLLSHDHDDRKPLAVREQKMEANAGLVLNVEYDPSLAGNPNAAGFYRVEAYRIERENPDNPLSKVNWDANEDANYIPVTLPPGIVGAPDEDFKDIRLSGDRLVEKYGENAGKVETGLYDHRDDLPVHTLALDVGALKEYIEEGNPADWGGTFDVAKNWNGVIYVKFPTSNHQAGGGQFQEGTSSGQNDYKIVKSANESLALMLIDGESLPDPDGGKTGFTVGTNAPVYVVGNYNADGKHHTGNAAFDSSTTPDEDEVPAAIIGDIVTILSNNWPRNRENSKVDYISSPGNRDDRLASHTEIAAAIMSGTPISIPEGASHTQDRNKYRPLSLGVVNLPRFLEYWGAGKTLTIRGSLVSLYQSEVRPEGAPTSGFNNWYNPPKRNWGFSDLFAAGQFPPGSPFVRTYRRSAFRELDRATFEAELSGLSNN